jgi:hypothetical protein
MFPLFGKPTASDATPVVRAGQGWISRAVARSLCSKQSLGQISHRWQAQFYKSDKGSGKSNIRT